MAAKENHLTTLQFLVPMTINLFSESLMIRKTFFFRSRGGGFEYTYPQILDFPDKCFRGKTLQLI
jgi:hypothetical protein